MQQMLVKSFRGNILYHTGDEVYLELIDENLTTISRYRAFIKNGELLIESKEVNKNERKTK